MGKTRIKVKIKSKPGRAGTLLARVPVTVAGTDKPRGERLFQTKAEIVTHIRRGERSDTFKPRGTD